MLLRGCADPVGRARQKVNRERVELVDLVVLDLVVGILENDEIDFGQNFGGATPSLAPQTMGIGILA